MKRSFYRIFLTLFLLCTVCLLAACNAPAKTEDSGYPEKPGQSYENPMDPPEKMETDNSLLASDISNPSEEQTEKIIKNVSLVMQTKKYDDAISLLRQSVAALGGYEESLRVNGRSYQSNGYYTRNAEMTIRIPAERLDDFLSQVGKNPILNVTEQTESAANVTAQYYDIQARIAVLESERSAYEAMLEKAEDIAYVLEIKQRMYDVIEELEAYRTKLRYYDNKVSYSTVNLVLNEVVEYTPVTDQAPSFGQRLSQAFVTGWKNFSVAFQVISVGLVYALPLLLIIGLLLTVSILLSRRSLRRRIKRNQAAKGENPVDAGKHPQ